jgi:hypothetical protein
MRSTSFNKTLWVVAAVGAVASAQAFTTINDPDAAYLAATTKIDISGLSDFTTVTSISDGGLTVSFSSTMQKRSVPGSWGTWASAPHAESSTPHILFSQGQNTVTMSFSSKVAVFGFEAEPNPFDVRNMTANFYDGATLVGSITRPVDGFAGSRLFAASGGFTHVVFGSNADWSAGQFRYAFDGGGGGTAIPGPAAALPMLLGLASAAIRRRKA